MLGAETLAAFFLWKHRIGYGHGRNSSDRLNSEKKPNCQIIQINGGDRVKRVIER